MASSSSSAPCRTWKYDVFPSFRGEDVRESFLSHLLKELDRKSIVTFIDDGIERSRQIAPELLSAIKESNISVVIFSENYASSTWCLNELVEIHNCFKELDQMVIPIFYKVDPSDVRKQTGKFGEGFSKTCEGFSKTCEGKTYEDQKTKWMQALREVANMAGEDSLNWSNEAKMIEQISKFVSKKLGTTTNDDLDDFVGIEAHLEKLNSLLGLESEGVRMVGIVGPSGIGKSTIARALYNQLSSQFPYGAAFEPYKKTNQDDYSMKLAWEKQFLDRSGMVKQRLKNKKVLVVLDNVEEIKVLDTLVGETGWFGNGSRIIVVTQDKALLNSHGIDPSLIYEVQHPSKEVALEMFCRSAFRKNSPPYGFMGLAAEVAELAGNLPLSLNVLGSSLRGKGMNEWEEMMPRIQGGLDDQIWKTLKVCYDRLVDKRDQDLFLYIACLFNGESVNRIKNLLEDGVYTAVSARLTLLADKSLIRIIAPEKTVEMHILLQKLGREIVREESKGNLGKRRFLVDAEDIRHVLTKKTGTDKVLGICLNASDIDSRKPLFIDENSFKGMHNLKFLKIYYSGDWWDKSSQVRLKSPQGLVFSFWSRPQGLVYLPDTLRLLHWDDYPGKYLPFSLSAEYLVELILEKSKLEKLWERTHNEEHTPLQRLKKMDLRGSEQLKEITNLSNATNLEELDLTYCTSLVTNPSSIRNLKKLRVLKMAHSKLEFLPTDVNLKFLEHLDLTYCTRLTSFPRISKSISKLYLQGTAMKDVEDSLWIKNISGLTHLHWDHCPLRCMPSNFNTEHLVDLYILGRKLEKLWEGVKELENLKSMYLLSCYNLTDIPDLSKATNLVHMYLSDCDKLTDIPDLSKATNLEYLHLRDCKSLVMLHRSIWNSHMLKELDMSGCASLEVLPTDVNMVSLEKLILSKCSQLRNFPQISTNIKKLDLDQTAIEEVPSWILNMSKLQELDMSYSERLKNISPSIFKLRHLKKASFSHCKELTSFSDANFSHCKFFTLQTSPDFRDFQSDNLKSFGFDDCMNLDQNAQEFILQLSFPMITVLPGGEVPTYFTNQTCGSSLIIKLSQSCPSHEVLRFKACIVVGSNFYGVKVIWRLRGLKGVKFFDLWQCVHPMNFDPWGEDHDMNFEITNHLVVFNFDLAFNSHPSELDDNDMKFQFLLVDIDERCEKDMIERCGIRLLDDSQSPDAAATRISPDFKIVKRKKKQIRRTSSSF